MTCEVKDCAKPILARGLCAAHYAKLRKYGDPLFVKVVQFHGLSLKDRLLARVNKTTKCWEWTGSRDSKGYGRLNVGNKPILAHRISWEVHKGPIPEGAQVLHHCDNPPCVRPYHLFLGSYAENTADKMAKGRHRYGHNPGELHGCSKLTEAEVHEIRASSEMGIHLAVKYGVTPQTISDIRTLTSWRHLID